MRLKWNRVVMVAVAGMLTVALAQATPTPPNTLTPIENQVRHEIIMLPYYNVFDNISFQVNNGVVTLMGQVTWPTVKTDAGRVVAKIPGVQKVDNKIEVLPLSRFDDMIRLRVYRAIYGNQAMLEYAVQPIAPIRIIVKNGNVTLIGNVNSELAKSVANIEANGVPGVFSVRDDIHVVTS